MGRSRSIPSIPRISRQNDTGSMLAAGVGAGMSSTGGTTLSMCNSGDDSFYCKFIRFFNMLKMIIFLIVLVVVIYFVYNTFVSNTSLFSGKRR
jgi:hypothetical protein